jgi:hypothetical protein
MVLCGIGLPLLFQGRRVPISLFHIAQRQWRLRLGAFSRARRLFVCGTAVLFAGFGCTYSIHIYMRSNANVTAANQNSL